jgi:hypothetical protein
MNMNIIYLLRWKSRVRLSLISRRRSCVDTLKDKLELSEVSSGHSPWPLAT